MTVSESGDVVVGKDGRFKSVRFVMSPAIPWLIIPDQAHSGNRLASKYQLRDSSCEFPCRLVW